MVVSGKMEAPVVLTTELKTVRNGFGTIPEETVFKVVGGGGVVDVESGIVVGELVHNVAELGEVGDDTGVVFPKTSSVFEIGLAEDEGAVDVCANDWLDIQTVLKR